MGEMKIESQSENRMPIFKEYAAMWLNDYIKGIRRSSTFERYGDALKKHVYPVLGNKLLIEITRGEVRNLLLRLYNSGLSKSMIRIIHACISGPMAYAVDEEIIPANPITGLTKRLQLKADNEPVEPMTREEIELFLNGCSKYFPENYAFFLCDFRTGMRLGELCGLQLGNIDWNGKFINVRRSYKRKKYGPTKSGQARRVDMSDQLTVTLKALVNERKIRVMPSDEQDILEEPLFQRGGKPFEQNYIRRIFKTNSKEGRFA